MLDNRTRVLTETLQKFFRRGAKKNIQKVLQKTHPADLGAIFEGLEHSERLGILVLEPSLDRRAEILSYMDETVQKDIIMSLDDRLSRELVSHMDSDDAADLLESLPQAASQNILDSMVKEDSQEVSELMGYPPDSAGGLMNSDYLSLQDQQTVNDAIKAIQNEEDMVTFYLYVTNEHGHLVGVISLKELLLAKPDQKLSSLMTSDVVSVTVDTSQQDVARIVERYDFLCLPVVDHSNELVGVITVDDVIDVIREEAEEDMMAMGRVNYAEDLTLVGQTKARLPWVAFNFLGGSACFSIIYFFTLRQHDLENFKQWWVAAAMTPLLLSVGATTGNQAAAVTIGESRTEYLDWNLIGTHLWRELKLSFLIGSFFALLAGALGHYAVGLAGLGWFLGLALFIQIFLSTAVGSLVPLLSQRFGLDPTLSTVPLFLVVVDISGVIILFGLISQIGGA